MALAALPALVACSATDNGASGTRVGADNGNEGPGFFDPASGNGGGGATPSGQGGTNGLVEPEGPGDGQITVDEACVVDQAAAALVVQPVDIILVLDNSGSMHEEMGSVERNINQNFATILTTGGVDYRVILLSRHRSGERTTGETEANTSVCVSAPLSGLPSCPAEDPVFTERFVQYGEKIESFDAMNWVLDAYDTPPDNDDDAELIPTGYGAFLRDGAKKIIMVLTDDNEGKLVDDDGDVADENPLTIPQFLESLSALSTAHFGTPQAPTFTFHSIIGLKAKPDRAAYLPNEPVQTEKCTAPNTTIPDVGTFYQELSIRTGGLRFPICDYDAYDAVFQSVAQDVVVSNIACDFPVPAPPAGFELDLSKVAIQYTPGNGGAPIQFGQAPAFSACQANAFYIADGRATMCPEACAAVRRDVRAAVSVLFTCESTIIIQ